MVDVLRLQPRPTLKMNYGNCTRLPSSTSPAQPAPPPPPPPLPPHGQAGGGRMTPQLGKRSWSQNSEHQTGVASTERSETIIQQTLSTQLHQKHDMLEARLRQQAAVLAGVHDQLKSQQQLQDNTVYKILMAILHKQEAKLQGQNRMLRQLQGEFRRRQHGEGLENVSKESSQQASDSDHSSGQSTNPASLGSPKSQSGQHIVDAELSSESTPSDSSDMPSPPQHGVRPRIEMPHNFQTFHRNKSSSGEMISPKPRGYSASLSSSSSLSSQFSSSTCPQPLSPGSSSSSGSCTYTSRLGQGPLYDSGRKSFNNPTSQTQGLWNRLSNGQPASVIKTEDDGCGDNRNIARSHSASSIESGYGWSVKGGNMTDSNEPLGSRGGLHSRVNPMGVIGSQFNSGLGGSSGKGINSGGRVSNSGAGFNSGGNIYRDTKTGEKFHRGGNESGAGLNIDIGGTTGRVSEGQNAVTGGLTLPRGMTMAGDINNRGMDMIRGSTLPNRGALINNTGVFPSKEVKSSGATKAFMRTPNLANHSHGTPAAYGLENMTATLPPMDLSENPEMVLADMLTGFDREELGQYMGPAPSDALTQNFHQLPTPSSLSMQSLTSNHYQPHLAQAAIQPSPAYFSHHAHVLNPRHQGSGYRLLPGSHTPTDQNRHNTRWM